MNNISEHEENLDIIFVVVIWSLWRARNETILSNMTTNFSLFSREIRKLVDSLVDS